MTNTKDIIRETIKTAARSGAKPSAAEVIRLCAANFNAANGTKLSPSAFLAHAGVTAGAIALRCSWIKATSYKIVPR